MPSPTASLPGAAAPRAALRCALAWIAGLTLLVPGRPASADLVINTVFLPQGTFINATFGSTTAQPGTAVGGGTLQGAVERAATMWESAIGDNHTLTLFYGWAVIPDATTLAGYASLTRGGVPERDLQGLILFDSDSFNWFLDATPGLNEEFNTYTETTQDLGGGLLNTGRVFTGATGDASGRFDAVGVAIHEIGHGLGLNPSYTAYQNEISGDNDIDVTAPLPFAGSTLPSTGGHLNLGNASTFPTYSTGTRRILSGADILGAAEVSQFSTVNLVPAAALTPEPGSLALFGLGIAGVVSLRRRRRASEAEEASAGASEHCG